MRLLPFLIVGLFRKNGMRCYQSARNGNLVGNGNLLLKFGELDLKHPILEVSSSFDFANDSDGEGTRHQAIAALPADIVAVIVLLVIAVFPLGGKGEIVVFVAQGNIFLLEAGKVGSKFLGRAVVFDIDFEAKIACASEGGIKGIQQAIEQLAFFSHKIVASCKWNQTKHDDQSPFMDIKTNLAGAFGNLSLFLQPLAIIIIPIKVKMSISQKEKV